MITNKTALFLHIKCHGNRIGVTSVCTFGGYCQSICLPFFKNIFTHSKSLYVFIINNIIRCNEIVVIYLFSFDTKTATVCSLITILFAQISKLATTAFITGFSGFDLSVLPVMIIGAVSGGFIGAILNKKCKEEIVEKAFNGVQVFVFVVTIFNIVKNLI